MVYIHIAIEAYGKNEKQKSIGKGNVVRVLASEVNCEVDYPQSTMHGCALTIG